MDDEESLPGYTPKQTSVNVLVVGETQNGKSSLIKRISDYSGGPDIDIGIGNGNTSKTKSVNAYAITVTPQEYHLVDMDGNPIQGKSYTELCGLTRSEARIVPVPDETAQPITFNFIDTPGLNDSDGDDMLNMAHIVGKCSQVSHLNALIYVRSVDQPLGKSFQDFFRYLQRCLTTFSNGFIVLHTRFSTDIVAENLNENVDLAKIRQEAFQQTVNSSLEHFFLDTKPPKRSPFAQIQSMNEIARFLSHLQAQLAQPSDSFKLVKTYTMKNVDVHVQNALNEAKNRLEREREKDCRVGDTFRHNTAFHEAEISRLKVRASTLSTEINKLMNGPSVVLYTKTYSDSYELTNLVRFKTRLDKIDAEYVADHPIEEVTYSQRSGSTWLNKTVQGNVWKATLRAAAFRDIGGSATFYASSSIHNKKVIDVLQETEREIKDSILAQERAIERNQAGEAYNENAVVMGRNLGKIETLLVKVAGEEFDMMLWPLLKGFYAVTKPLSRYQIREFVRIYDPDVAELLPI